MVIKNIVDSVNYIVTTKGIPLKIKRAACYDIYTGGFARCSSVDNELTLILGPHSDYISQPYFIDNPYLHSDTLFSRKKYGIYLVTRLDGVNKMDVLNLIDRSGPGIKIDIGNSKAVLDIGWVAEKPNSSGSYFLQGLQDLKSNNENHGLETSLFADTNKIEYFSNVVGYYMLNYNQTDKTYYCDFVPGSIGEQLDLFELSDTVGSRNTYNSLPFIKTIEQGITGISGNVYPTFVRMLVQIDVLFENYFWSPQKRNLAESYYSSITKLSASNVFVGDPKTSIIIEHPLGVGNNSLISNGLRIFPNPNNGQFTIEASDFEIKNIKIMDSYGALLAQSSGINVDINNLCENGLYLVEVETNKGLMRKKIVVAK